MRAGGRIESRAHFIRLTLRACDCKVRGIKRGRKSALPKFTSMTGSLLEPSESSSRQEMEKIKGYIVSSKSIGTSRPGHCLYYTLKTLRWDGIEIKR